MHKIENLLDIQGKNFKQNKYTYIYDELSYLLNLQEDLVKKGDKQKKIEETHRKAKEWMLNVWEMWEISFL